MQYDVGILNDNGFHLKQRWENGTTIDDDFKPRTALFRADGTLLSFDLRYADGYVASINLVPEKQWVEQGLAFFHNWLAPIGLEVLKDQVRFNPERHKNAALYDSLAGFAIDQLGTAALRFLTKGVSDNNLVYVNIYTNVVYKRRPIVFSPASVFS